MDDPRLALRRWQAPVDAPAKTAGPAWVARALGTAGGGFGFYAAAPIVGMPQWGTVALLAGLAGAGHAAVTGSRATQRAALVGALAEALAPVLGVRPPAHTTRAWRWRGGWVGHPTRIRLTYAPAVNDTDPAWIPTILDITARRLLTAYEVAGHNRRRRELTLRPFIRPESAPAAPALQLRAERTVRELLGSTAAIEPAWNNGELVALEVRHEAGVKAVSAQYRARVERTVSAMLPGRWRGNWDLEQDLARFEVRPTLPQKIPRPAPSSKPEDAHRIPLGVAEDGDTVYWDLRTSPHMLVVGGTGTGKTVGIQGTVTEVAFRGSAVWICDPKRVEFLGMRAWPNVQIVATTVLDQVALVCLAWKEMETRYALIESGDITEDDLEPMFFVMDEYRDFYANVSGWYSTVKVPGMPSTCPAFEKYGSLARKARSAQIHLIAGTQRPDAAYLDGGIRDQFAARQSLGRLSPQGAMMMWDNAYTGVAVPRDIKGRGIGVNVDGKATEMQTYWTPDPRRVGSEEDQRILEALYPKDIKHPQLQLQMSEELLTELDSKNRSQEWQAVMTAELVPALHNSVMNDHEQRRPSLQLVSLPSLDSPAPVGPVDDDESDDIYGPLQHLSAEELAPGDLVLVEEDPPVWAVAEAVTEDPCDVGYLCVEWRTDDDDAGVLSLSEDQKVLIRRPHESLVP